VNLDSAVVQPPDREINFEDSPSIQQALSVGDPEQRFIQIGASLGAETSEIFSNAQYSWLTKKFWKARQQKLLHENNNIIWDFNTSIAILKEWRKRLYDTHGKSYGNQIFMKYYNSLGVLYDDQERKVNNLTKTVEDTVAEIAKIAEKEGLCNPRYAWSAGRKDVVFTCNVCTYDVVTALGHQQYLPRNNNGTRLSAGELYASLKQNGAQQGWRTPQSDAEFYSMLAAGNYFVGGWRNDDGGGHSYTVFGAKVSGKTVPVLYQASANIAFQYIPEGDEKIYIKDIFGRPIISQ
jgi:hypothetical protein